MSALTIIKNLTLTLALGLSLSASAAVLQFPTESHFATGHWVKVNYTKTGIYEISYDELKAMGFSDPGKVAVFGHGGYLQDAQFVDAEGKALYQTELQPVAMYRAGDKLFFYGQGPELLRQMIENNNRKDSMQFERVNRNFYSQGGSYFLTDSREGMIPEEVLRTYNYSLPRFYYGFMVDYHEADTSMPNSFGREAFGETLTPGTPLTFQYSLPGVLTKDFTPSTASEKALNLNTYLTLRAANNSSSYSSLKTSVGNGTDDISYSFGLQQANRTDYYTTNRMRYLYGRIPSESGTITFDLNGAPTWANLDYYILAGRARMTFPEDAASITYYVNDYDPTKNGGLNLNIMPSDIVAWDVVNPNDVSQLSVQLNGDGGWLRYYRQGKNLGNLVAFSPSRTQMSIDSWSQVSATSLHKLGTETMPALLIITLPEYEQQARRIADLHKRFEGIETAIVFSEDVFNEFSAGVPDPIAYRALAKMIYDRDDPADRKFKNILMLGPTLRDFANIEGKNPGATLLCNLTPDGANLEQTFTLNDWYGMLEDRTLYTPNDDAANFAQVPMQVGVGNLPAQSPADADVYIDKLEAYYADNSFASWLTETIFVADAGDDNEHQNMSDNCFDDLMQTSGRAFTGNKLYTNFYPAGGVTQAFIKKLNEGSILTTYMGHASITGLSGEFWNFYNERELKNNRLGFMTVAGCDITHFELGVRGSGERLVFLPKYGLVGSLLTSRQCYSLSNALNAQFFQRAAVLDDPAGTALLSAPRTIGEVYALSKNAYTVSSNKHAYLLLSDPALVVPFPSATVTATIDGSTEGVLQVSPHQKLELTGTVTDRKGQILTDFNGTVVAKVFNSPRQQLTTPRYSYSPSPAKLVTLDQDMMASFEFEVKEGKYSGTVLLPSNLTAGDNGYATLRLGAYDPSSRRGAAGVRELNVGDYDPSAAVASDLPPSIEEMYVNTPDTEEGMPVASSFTLHATVTDDYCAMSYPVNGIASLILTIDNLHTFPVLNEQVSTHNDGKTLKVVYPVSGLLPGMHILSLLASDSEGQTTTRTISVNVGESTLTGTLSTPDEPARDSATFTLEGGNDAKATLVILNAEGREIYTAAMPDSEFEWDLKDSEGNRVAAGIYRAVVRLTGSAMNGGATNMVKFTVFAAK